jgi:disulfide bond formation protein DsbB
MKYTQQQLIAFITLASTGVLGGALVSQYGFGLHPCHLCLLQRVPHAGVIALGIAALVTRKHQRIMLALMGAILLMGAGIALYHVGVEHGMFEAGCSAKYPVGMSTEDMRKAIAEAPLVTCDQAMGYVFGVSLAAWNAIISIGLSIASFFFLYKTPRPAKS